MNKEERFPYETYKQIYLDQTKNKNIDEKTIKEEYNKFLKDDEFENMAELLEMLLKGAEEEEYSRKR